MKMLCDQYIWHTVSRYFLYTLICVSNFKFPLCGIDKGRLLYVSEWNDLSGKVKIKMNRLWKNKNTQCKMIKWNDLTSPYIEDYNKLCFPFLTCQRFSHTLWEDVVNFFCTLTQRQRDANFLSLVLARMYLNTPPPRALTQAMQQCNCECCNQQEKYYKQKKTTKQNVEVTCFRFESFKITSNFLQGDTTYFWTVCSKRKQQSNH